MRTARTLQNVFSAVVLLCCLEMSRTFPTADILSDPEEPTQLTYNQELSGFPIIGMEDLMKQKRSFASFRFRPKNLESLIMINRAYDLMNNINALINDGENGSDFSDPEMEARAKERAQALIANRLKGVRGARKNLGH